MFNKAKRIFIKNKNQTVNFQSGYKCTFNAEISKEYILNITGESLYEVYLNNEYIFYGPARAPHGYKRYDEIKLDVKQGENIICINLAGYNTASFYTFDEHSFIQAEIFENGETIKYTGKDFSAISLSALREQAVYRYSHQRTYTEVWHYDNNDLYTNWKSMNFESEPINTYPDVQELIPRGFENPKFKIIENAAVIGHGRFRHKNDFNSYDKRYITGFSYKNKGFPLNEIKYDTINAIHGKYFADEYTDMCENRYTLYSLGQINTGFIRTEIKANEDSEVYVIFSEKLCENHPDSGIYGLEANNVVMYDLKKSDIPYNLQTFEVYSFMYVAVLVVKGDIDVKKIGIREYSYPHYEAAEMSCDDDLLNKIFTASKETYRQNTIDCFMDCPGRERAGWLCDSYFTGKSSLLMSGNTKAEELFLKNFVMAKDFPNLTEGLLPMIYPSGNLGVIPQWVMWYVFEVREYINRSGDDKSYFAPTCRAFYDYLQKYENEDGLLTKLPGWNFIEWSEANEYVDECDVSYPTNMLYKRLLEDIGYICDDTSISDKAINVKNKLIEKAYDGRFFYDGEINGKRITSKSEACQSYAVFASVAEPNDSRFDKFFEVYFDKLGYKRKLKGEMPELAFGAVFIGLTIRLETLKNMGKYDILLDEIKTLYAHMAESTLTLWEHDDGMSSLNHALSSVAGVYMIQAMTGLAVIDEANKSIVFNRKYSKKQKYNITLNLNNSKISVIFDGNERLIISKGDYKVVYRE